MTTPIDQKWIDLLQQRRVAAVSTLRADGTIQMSAAWYLFEDGRFLLAVPSESAKVKNIRRNPTASILVDARTAGREKGVSVTGTATIIEGADAQPVIERIHAAFVDDEALRDPVMSQAFAELHEAVLVLDPERWSHWDMEELDQLYFGGRFLADSLIRPLADEAPPLPEPAPST